MTATPWLLHGDPFPWLWVVLAAGPSVWLMVGAIRDWSPVRRLVVEDRARSSI